MFVKFAELPVFDQDRAVAFYTGKLSWRVATDSTYQKDGWRWIELAYPGAQTCLLLGRRNDDTPSDTPVLVLVVDDVQGLVDKLQADGVEIITAPTSAPWDKSTTYAEFRDSEGNRIVVNQER